MLYRYLVGCITIIFFAATAIAEIGDELWMQIYNRTGADSATSIVQTSDGGFAIAGWKTTGTNNKDIFLIRTDSSGYFLWDRTYGGSLDDVANSILTTTDNGLIMAGWTKSRGAGGTDVLIIKTNESGDTAWTRTFGGVNDDTARCIKPTSDNGYIICGVTDFDDGMGRSFKNYWFKINASGARQWGYCSGGRWGDCANSIIPVSGGFVFTGWNRSSAGINCVHAEKINSSGTNVWTQTYSQIPNSIGHSITQLSDGQFIIAGEVTTQASGRQTLLMKINTTGDLVWNYDFGDNDLEAGYSVCRTFDGGFISGGIKTTGVSPDSSDFYLIKTDAGGTFEWDKAFSLGSRGRGSAIIIASDSNYVMAGSSNLTDSVYSDFCLLKIQGKEIVNIDQFNDNLPTAFQIQPNYPNPFNSQTVINYSLAEESIVKIHIYDIMGRMIDRLFEGSQPAGNHQITWAASEMASGIYFCKICTGPKSDIGRMMLIK
jgi:hypothetical protein